jgi:hypothetical protein
VVCCTCFWKFVHETEYLSRELKLKQQSHERRTNQQLLTARQQDRHWKVNASGPERPRGETLFGCDATMATHRQRSEVVSRNYPNISLIINDCSHLRISHSFVQNQRVVVVDLSHHVVGS